MTVARLYQPNKALTDYKQCSDMSLTYNSCWYNSGWIFQVKKWIKMKLQHVQRHKLYIID